MRRTILGVVAAVVLAAVGTAILVGFVQQAEQRALAGEETVEVLVVDEDIPRGTAARDIGPSVVTQRIPAKVRPQAGVATLDDLEGKVARVDLVPGEQLLATRFAEPADLERESGIEVPPELQEVTVSLEPQRAVGGRIQPGDTVGFVASFDFQDGRDEEEIANEEQEYLRQELSETTKLILHKLLVTNVQVEELPQAPTEDEDGDNSGQGPELAPTGNLLITLAVNVPQAERIVFSAEHGTVWLSSQTEDTDESGSLLRTPRNIYDD